MDYSRIPEEMKKLNQWVCAWDSSKVPMRAFERKAASSVDRETWGSFEQATWAVENGYYDHIGFVFADSGIIGIDIDVGFEDGLLTPLCADIMNRCRSYTEISKSGRGVHILLHGDLPFTGKNNLAGVEIYKSRRFFITTGDVLLFSQIEDNQPAIDYVLEKYFPEREKENNCTSSNPRIYTPHYRKPENGKFFLRPEYPPIAAGGRNLSLASLAGSMHTAGYSSADIYKELCYVNQSKCDPPLDVREIQCIVNSITKYRR